MTAEICKSKPGQDVADAIAQHPGNLLQKIDSGTRV